MRVRVEEHNRLWVVRLYDWRGQLVMFTTEPTVQDALRYVERYFNNV